MYQSKFLSHLRCNTTAKGITTLLDLIRIIRIICICILLSAAEPADTGVSSLCCSAAAAPAILGCLHPPWKEDLIFRQCQTRLLWQHQNPTNGRCCCCSSLCWKLLDGWLELQTPVAQLYFVQHFIFLPIQFQLSKFFFFSVGSLAKS